MSAPGFLLGRRKLGSSCVCAVAGKNYVWLFDTWRAGALACLLCHLFRSFQSKNQICVAKKMFWNARDCCQSCRRVCLVISPLVGFCIQSNCICVVSLHYISVRCTLTCRQRWGSFFVSVAPNRRVDDVELRRIVNLFRLEGMVKLFHAFF